MPAKKTKKTKKKHKAKVEKKNSIEKEPLSIESWGMLLLGVTAFITLSLLSFVDGEGSSNTFGLLGHALAWGMHYLFGLGAYFIICLMAGIAWKCLCGQKISLSPFGSLLSFALCFNLISTVIAERFPQTVQETFGQRIYSELVEGEQSNWDYKMRHYLGGAPLYFIYADMKPYNLRRVLNDWGILFLASAGLVLSIMRSFGISPTGLIIRAKSLFSREMQEVSNPDVHYVKLRKMDSAADVEENGAKAHSSPKDELLPIQPELELKERPSLSAKILLSEGKKLEPSTHKPSIQEPSEPPMEESSAPIPASPKVSSQKDKRQAALSAQRVYNGDFSEYSMPSAKILTKPQKVDQTALKKDLKRQAEVLQETLHSFGIDAKVGRINCGPTITLFEVHPSIGVKVQKIRALEHDIALNMEAKSIRIIAPIPGKAAVGIEVPNPYPQEVSFRELLAAYKQEKRTLELPLLLGKTVNGENVIADLCKMPHLIIAGATGSGKSVCINTIVMSLLMNAQPDQVKLLMVDPKKVELTSYSALPHMLAPVITEPQGACAALNWLVKEMERRYDLLKAVGVRNIRGFNSRKRNLEYEESLGIEIPEKLPYIVGIIDELADLMMVSSSDIETPVARIAQMARAVGIHMILATQRPSREVITGIIKANFPTRIAFKVASRVNSQIILDETGAETLLGNGDMLFLPPGSHNLVRAQGAFIRDEDITATIQHICSQAPPNYVISSFDELGTLDCGEESSEDKSLANVDSLYPKASKLVKEEGSASITFLQRKLKVGYARAASIIDQLEENGIVGPSEGAKPRRVLEREPIQAQAGGEDVES